MKAELRYVLEGALGRPRGRYLRRAYPNAIPGSISAERAARIAARARGELGGIYQRWRGGNGLHYRTRKDALHACPGVPPVLVTGRQDAPDYSRRGPAQIVTLPIRVADEPVEQLLEAA